jgi:pimeloyl-ACP methyl ester carboxylesterase
MPVTVLRTADGALDSNDSDALGDLQKRLSCGKKKVLLYLHGGLVDQGSGQNIAAKLSGKGPSALGVPDDWEQIYIVWRTGLKETLKNNWQDLLENDRLYKALVKRLVSYFSEKLEGASAGRGGEEAPKLTDVAIEDEIRTGSDAPFAQIDDRHAARARAAGTLPVDDVDEQDMKKELDYALELDNDIVLASQEIEAYIAEASSDVTRGSYEADAIKGERQFKRLDKVIRETLIEEDPATGRSRAFGGLGVLGAVVGHGYKIAVRVLGRFKGRRDHGLYATIVEEVARQLYGDLIGSAIWGMMTKDAADHFASGKFGRELVAALAANKDADLLVVGHSAGSIWATEFLNARKRMGDDSPLSLVLLAPAVRIKKFASMLDACGSSIVRFRMFAMKDELERTDVLLGKGYGFLYPSSLLYLVSGLFENEGSEPYSDAPILGMARFVSADPDWLSEQDEAAALRKVRDFLGAEPDRVVYSETANGDRFGSRSRSHGGFDDDVDTLASIASHWLGNAQ